MRQNTPIRQNASGNVLFLILIAVALFAALSYAVTQSSKGGGSGINKDKARLLASEIAQYGASIEHAITRMTLINQCTDTQISFEHHLDPPANANPGAPADKSCHVFDANGCGVSVRRFDFATYVRYATQSNILNVGTDCAATECAELYLWIRTAADKITCMAFNDVVKVPNIAGDAPPASGLYGTHFKGTHIYGNVFGNGINGPAFKGQRAGCHYDTNEDKYDFYYVLYAR